MRTMISNVCQLAVLLVVLATAPLNEAARDMLAAPVYVPSDFRQCGGVGGSCAGSKAAKCKDAQWPANEGGKCKSGLTCYRVSQYHWGCDTKQPATSPPSKPTKATTSPSKPPQYVGADFRQCGGKGGSCSGSNAAKCKDAQWPASEGGMCKAGLTCYRVSQYHWGCDKKQPPTATPSKMTEAPIKPTTATGAPVMPTTATEAPVKPTVATTAPSAPPMYVDADFKQCGGRGGSCTGSSAPKCKNAQWPTSEGGSCKAGLTCFKVSQYYYSCDVTAPPTKTPTAVITKNDYTQCGGRGGSCDGSKAAKCKDARWPSSQGGSCKSSLKCYRISQYYWQCDQKNPVG